MTKKNLNYIQAIRGIAALSVVLFHSSRFLSPYGTGLGDTLFGPMSYMGVSIFFMISGFIMVASTTSSDGTLKYALAFIIKRFCRIWPIYFIATIAYLAVRYGTYVFFDESKIAALLKSILFIPLSNSQAPVFGFPSLVVGWTLNYEIFFYMLFALSLLFGDFRWVFLFSSSLLLLIITPWSYGGFSFSPRHEYGFTTPFINLATSPIIWLFLVGVMIGFVHKSKFYFKSQITGTLLFLASASLIVAQYILRYRIGHGVFECGLTLIPFLLISTIYFKSFNDFTPSLLVGLGNVSFSLYLWHPMIQTVTPKIFEKLGMHSITDGFPAIFITTTLSLLLAVISKTLLEDALSNRIRDAILGYLAICKKKDHPVTGER